MIDNNYTYICIYDSHLPFICIATHRCFIVEFTSSRLYLKSRHGINILIHAGREARNVLYRRDIVEFLAANQVTVQNTIFGNKFSNPSPDWLRESLSHIVSFVQRA